MKQERLNKEVNKGKVFIYPTDTVYGLGCNAENKEVVDKIKEIKGRNKKKPLSVIAPSKDWIENNLVVDVNLDKYLPGSYTLLLDKKNQDWLKHVSPNEKLGVRIPDHDFCKKIQKTNCPFITTSANKSGEKPATNLENISKEIKNRANYIIKTREKLSGSPSTLVINGKEIKR